MTKVCFRRDESFYPGVIAVFPEIKWDDLPSLTSYEHFGQHSGCTADYVRFETRPATVEEYQPLLEELKSIGYNDLVILKKMPRLASKFYGV